MKQIEDVKKIRMSMQKMHAYSGIDYTSWLRWISIGRSIQWWKCNDTIFLFITFYFLIGWFIRFFFSLFLLRTNVDARYSPHHRNVYKNDFHVSSHFNLALLSMQFQASNGNRIHETTLFYIAYMNASLQFHQLPFFPPIMVYM